MEEIEVKGYNREESEEIKTLLRSLRVRIGKNFDAVEIGHIRHRLRQLLEMKDCRDVHGLSKILMSLRTAELFASGVDADHDIIAAILLYPLFVAGKADSGEIRDEWGDDVVSLLRGMARVIHFSSKQNIRNAENYRGLILSLAEDIRVVIIMIVRSLALMRSINLHPDEIWVRSVAFEANCLYAQLSHRLGLYKIKSELEDLSLKYTNREIYKQIANKLNETKRVRDAYIASFIAPVKEKLEAAGLKFTIKGRTKSISSIWAKIRKQKTDLQHIYDLFAIRIIIDADKNKEKSDCWLAYSIVTDMYTANPARLKDWITLPKSNGYESLHTTVLGPESKWVEVQIRTKRMDLVAEKGLAAHWRYKGVKGDSTDQWMNNIRDILETADSGPMQLMKDMRIGLMEKEVYAFTPKGDLFRLSPGATVLDFAFLIHSNVGSHCTGAVVNGVNRKLNYKICNGDTVEILTSASQKPKVDWLNIVVSSKARNKIRQSLNEEKLHKAELGKELLERRAKNRKIEMEESSMMKLIKKSGYRYANDFFADLAEEKIDALKFIAAYEKEAAGHEEESEHISADEFKLKENEFSEADHDVLVIGEKNIRGLKYKFAGCCSAVCGDDVFGFISSDGVVKIHRNDCPNAANIKRRYPYRLIRVEWGGAKGDLLPVTLKIIGHDDIGIVTNVTSIIAKEKDMVLRNISIDANDGIFQGILVINVSDRQQLSRLIKKLQTVKGVKNVTRI